ncbi:MAG: hypothetical protein GVY25_02780 [Bacteroidetes bacterium]|jgi:hypothetical protein|nr:hypothetical protein [Bacteroidota bacterium]
MPRAVFAATIVVSLLVGAAEAQPIPYDEVDDVDFVYIMNRVQVLGEVANDRLAVRVLSVENLPGSADSPSGEVTSAVYVGVSEYDELPAQRLFRFEDLMAPEVERMNEGSLGVSLTFGPADARRSVCVEPSLTTLNVTEKACPR